MCILEKLNHYIPIMVAITSFQLIVLVTGNADIQKQDTKIYSLGMHERDTIRLPARSMINTKAKANESTILAWKKQWKAKMNIQSGCLCLINIIGVWKSNEVQDKLCDPLPLSVLSIYSLGFALCICTSVIQIQSKEKKKERDFGWIVEDCAIFQLLDCTKYTGQHFYA